MQYLTIKKANILYLICMLLVITLGFWLQSINFSIGLLLTEGVLIFLPAWYLLEREKINIPQSIKFRKISNSILLVSFLLGMGAWLLDSMIEILAIQITGYQIPAIPGMVPTNVLQAGLIFVGLAIAAPICEEFVFRGVIQSSYEKYFSPIKAVLVAGLLFALFHLRFQGFAGLLPITLILGFTYWRTRSIVASMVVHFANNLFSVIVLIQTGIFPGNHLPFPSLQAAIFGAFLLVSGLMLLIRLTPRPEPEAKVVEISTTNNRIANWWPIIVATSIFMIFAVLEVMNSSPINYLPLSSDHMPGHINLRYELRHKGDEVIGSGSCQISSGVEVIQLVCQRSSGAFEVQAGNSYFSSMAGSTAMNAQWNMTDLAIISLKQIDKTETFSNQWEINPFNDKSRIIVTNSRGFEDQFDFPSNILVTEEWPFRLMGLAFETQNTWMTSYLDPFGWREKTQDNGPVLKSNFLIQSSKETIKVPAGEFETWKVQLMNGQAAWYTVASPHLPVKIEGNVFDYYLLEQN